jgi:hypothetical protein
LGFERSPWYFDPRNAKFLVTPTPTYSFLQRTRGHRRLYPPFPRFNAAQHPDVLATRKLATIAANPAYRRATPT